MRKELFGIMAVLPMLAAAQSAMDAYQLQPTELRGSARYISMGGAFGALGGDISSLSKNPAGVGVYRSSDASLTLDLDAQSVKALDTKSNQTKFNCNNFGYVGAFRTGSESMPFFNIGFSYNRQASFNRKYAGVLRGVQQSITNQIAADTNSGGWTFDDLNPTDNYDPYVKSQAPWMSILANDAYLINPDENGKNFSGLASSGTGVAADYETIEKGGIDSFEFSFGGNVMDILYWGVNVGVTDMDYKSYTRYGETLTNAYIYAGDGAMTTGDASFDITNSIQTKGTGVNVNAGIILKPTNELRFGLAFHSPTYYDLTDYYYTMAVADYTDGVNVDYRREAGTNAGYDGVNDWKLQTPWRLVASAAGVIGGKAIISGDYEYVATGSMSVRDADDNVYADTEADIDNYYQGKHIISLGAEYRIDRNWSIRAGYSYQTSPTKDAVKNGTEQIYTVSTQPAYMFDNSVQHVTCGLGYRYDNFYTDLAYAHKFRESEWNAYYGGPSSTLKDNNNHVVWTLGFRF